MTELYTWFVEPLLRYEFMRNALAAAVVVGVSSAVLSCLLVVRHQALLGDAVSHAVLPGVALGWLVAGNVGVFWGALAAAVASGLAVTYVERHSSVKRDAVMGIVFTFAFALGLAVISVARPTGVDLFHVLLGNLLGVTREDLLLTAASGGLVLLVVVVLFRQLRLWSFDPITAHIRGVRTGLLSYVFTGLLSAAIVSALQAVGLVLVVAMLITPGATASLLTRRLHTMMAVAAILGLVAAVGGLYASYNLDVASGPAIVIVASLLFLVAFCLAPHRGVIAQAFIRRRSAARVLREDLLKSLFSMLHHGESATTSDLARRAGTSTAAVRTAVRGLRRADHVLGEGGQLVLTAAGREEALRMVRTHRLLERYLHDAEGVALSELHDAADRLEHHVSAAALDDIDRVLGSPAFDPHGHPIPSAAGVLATIAGRQLSDSPVGEPGLVAMVGDDRADLLEQMVALGVLPQRTVTVLAVEPRGVRADVSGSCVLIPTEVAARIFVVPATPTVERVASTPQERRL